MIQTTPTPSKTPTVSPNDVAEALTGRRYLSFSQLRSYRACPRQWFYSHVEQVEREFVASSLKFGGAIHTALQHHFEQRLIGDTTTPEQLIEVFHQAWQEDSDLPIKFGKSEDEAALHDLASRMLTAFAESELAQPAGDIVGVEETLTASIHPELPDLLGRVDVILQTEDVTHLIDVKTSRSRWSDAKLDESADQLLLYAQLASQLAEGKIPKLSFGVITKAKEPAIQVLDVESDADQVDTAIEVMLPVWRAMSQGIDFANPGPMTCSTCPFQSRCKAYRG